LKLERLLALIRLANNNPSDNEANAAARAVCKVLGANQHFMKTGNLQLRTAQAKVGVTPDGPKSTVTWNDVKRDVEPIFRSRRPNRGGYGSHFDETLWEYFNNINRKDAPEPEDSWDKEPPKRPQWDGGPFKTERSKATAQRKCTKCGLEVDTFRTKIEPFICNACSWKGAP